MTIDNIIRNGILITDSQIDDDFEGFEDENVFVLFNDEYWIQSEFKFWYTYSFMPNVKIYFYNGLYYLVIVNESEFVEVKRLDDVIECTIINDFDGWSGSTVFEMDNGQTWQQSSYDYNYNYSFRPKALIYNSGGYKMIFEGNKIDVKRIREN